MESWASLCTQTSVERLILEKICRSELGEHVRRVLNGVVENEMVSLKDVKQKACEVMKTSGRNDFAFFVKQYYVIGLVNTCIHKHVNINRSTCIDSDFIPLPLFAMQLQSFFTRFSYCSTYTQNPHAYMIRTLHTFLSAHSTPSHMPQEWRCK